MVSEGCRDLYWTPLDDPGCEHLHLDFTDEGMRALGLILRKWHDGHYRCRYELCCGPGWQFRSLSLAVSGAGEGSPTRLSLERDYAGNWLANGEECRDLKGCQDIDIEITPFTNSLPICRLGLREGESREIVVAYIPVLTLEPMPMLQNYTCARPVDGSGGLYRYQNPKSGFSADLQVDSDGLVLDYPGLYERSWPK